MMFIKNSIIASVCLTKVFASGNPAQPDDASSEIEESSRTFSKEPAAGAARPMFRHMTSNWDEPSLTPIADLAVITSNESHKAKHKAQSERSPPSSKKPGAAEKGADKPQLPDWPEMSDQNSTFNSRTTQFGKKAKESLRDLFKPGNILKIIGDTEYVLVTKQTRQVEKEKVDYDVGVQPLKNSKIASEDDMMLREDIYERIKNGLRPHDFEKAHSEMSMIEHLLKILFKKRPVRVKANERSEYVPILDVVGEHGDAQVLLMKKIRNWYQNGLKHPITSHVELKAFPVFETFLENAIKACEINDENERIDTQIKNRQMIMREDLLTAFYDRESMRIKKDKGKKGRRGGCGCRTN